MSPEKWPFTRKQDFLWGWSEWESCSPGYTWFDLMADQKTMQTSYLGGFSIMWVPKLLLTPEKLGFLAQKRPKLVQNMQFRSIWPNIGIFLPISSHGDQKPMTTRCLGGFSVMWVTKLLISPIKMRIFCPRTTKFGPKLAFLFILGRDLLAHFVPCWWVGWWFWRAGCISQDAYLLYWFIELLSLWRKKKVTRLLNDWIIEPPRKKSIIGDGSSIAL